MQKAVEKKLPKDKAKRLAKRAEERKAVAEGKAEPKKPASKKLPPAPTAEIWFDHVTYDKGDKTVTIFRDQPKGGRTKHTFSARYLEKIDAVRGWLSPETGNFVGYCRLPVGDVVSKMAKEMRLPREIPGEGGR